MEKIYTQSITRFDGGISDDPRASVSNQGVLIKHFDIFSNPFKLTPYRSTENESSTVSVADLKTYDIRDFQLGVNGLMYALGRTAANNFPQVFQKTDPTTGNWSLSTTGAGTATRINGCFFEWQSTWWMFSGTTNVSNYVIATNTFNNTVTGVLGATITSVAQGIVGADGNAYMFYNNRVVRINSSSVMSDNVMTAIPNDMRITSACRWGSYLVIACAYGTSNIAPPSGRSQLYIWDYVTSSTVSDIIDLGEGSVKVIGNVEGRIITVSDKYLTSALGITRGSMVVRMWSGGIPKVVKEIVANQTVTADVTAFPNTVTRFPRNVVIKDNKMYWVASVPFNLSTSTESTYHLGVWCYGRKNENYNFTLTIDYVEEAVSASNWFINSFGAAGNYWFFNHSADFSITKTDDAANYTFTSIYETQIFGNHRIKKKLIGVTVNTVYLPAAGQIVLKYRKDTDTAYTLIYTNTTDNSQSHSAVNLENLTAGGDTVTITIATPAVATLTAHGLVAGQIIWFTTTGALPTGITAQVEYYIISTGLTANAFQFSATSGGSAVNTSGSQSGTHTLRRDVTLPTYREIQFRIESTGGAEITGLEYNYMEVPDDIY